MKINCDCGVSFEPEIQYTHKLICGDSTDSEMVSTLLDGAQVRVTLTDPPFGVNYDESSEKKIIRVTGFGKRGGLKEVHNGYEESGDGRESDTLDFINFLPSDVLIMTYPVDVHFFNLADILKANKLILKRELVWVKDTFSFWSGSSYQQKHEPILVILRKGKPLRAQTLPNTSTVFEYPRPKAHKLHPTERPLGLWEELLSYNSEVDNLVYDPFVGSGTTIIAAERLGRRCFAVEISPHYCAVALERYYQMTDIEPILIKNDDG